MAPDKISSLLARIFRVFSYLYHLILALFLLGMGVVALLSKNRLQLEMLPWSGDELSYWLIGASLTGLLSVMLAVFGVFRFLFPLWSAVVVVFLVRGYLLQPTFAFSGKEALHFASWLIAGSLLAFLASLTLFARTRKAHRDW